jgi:hypothetical protein
MLILQRMVHFSLLQDHHVYLFDGSIPGSSLLQL